MTVNVFVASNIPQASPSLQESHEHIESVWFEPEALKEAIRDSAWIDGFSLSALELCHAHDLLWFRCFYAPRSSAWLCRMR